MFAMNIARIISIIFVLTLLGCAVARDSEKELVRHRERLHEELVMKIVDFVNSEKSTLAERFEEYFLVEVKKTARPNLADVLDFHGISEGLGVSIHGIQDLKKDQTATIAMDIENVCISPDELSKRFATLQRISHSDRYIDVANEDGPSALYAGYWIFGDYGYTNFYFKNNRCLRSVGVFRKIGS